MYKIGDKVKLRGIVSGADLNCRSGTIGGIKEYDSLTTNIDSNGNFVEKYYYRGILYYIKEIHWWIPPQNIVGYENKKLKRIENPEVDPYGEEDWGWEEIKENNSSPYGEENWENESIIYENLFEPKNEFCVKVNNKEEFKRLMVFLEEQGFSWHGLIKEPTAKEYSEEMEVVYSEPDGMLSYSNLYDYNFRYNSIPIYPVDIVINNKKYKKIENTKDDPYGEEDWGYEKIEETNHILKYRNFHKTIHYF